MSLLIERYGDYNIIQAVGFAFKEVQNQPETIRITLKGLRRTIYAIGILVILGPSVQSFIAGVKVTERTIMAFNGLSKIDLWANYHYNGLKALIRDTGITAAHLISIPLLLHDFNIILTLSSAFILLGSFLDYFISVNELITLFPKTLTKALEYRTARPLEKCKTKFEYWDETINNLPNKEAQESLIKEKSLKIEHLDPDILKASFIIYAHDKKVKWQKKELDLPTRRKANLYTLAYLITLSVMILFLALGTITSTPLLLTSATLTAPFASYLSVYSLLYKAFNPEPSKVIFK